MSALLQQPARDTEAAALCRASAEVIRRPVNQHLNTAGLPMTTFSSSVLVGSSEPQPLPGDLIDALIEAVVLPPNRSARSAVICSLVREICAALEWLDGDEQISGGARDEAISVQALLSAALDHHLRMTQLDAGTATVGAWYGDAPTAARWTTA